MTRKFYKVSEAFYSERNNITIKLDDIVYTNHADNNFYIDRQKKSDNMKITYLLDWCRIRQAISCGWLELSGVEERDVVE